MLLVVAVASGPVALSVTATPPPPASSLTARVAWTPGDLVHPTSEEVVLESEAGREALRAASALKKQAYALEGEEREAVLLRAAAAYGAVADAGDFGVLDRVVGAFRAGEILRARGKVAEAGERFGQAVSLGEPVADPEVREFAARALLEQAHQLRRDDEASRALEVYAAVRSRFGDSARAATHAVTWSGKILLKEGRLEEARRALMDFEPFFPGYPLDAVRNVDALVDGLLATGDADAAYEVVAVLDESITKYGETMTEASTRAVEALRDKVGQSGY